MQNTPINAEIALSDRSGRGSDRSGLIQRLNPTGLVHGIRPVGSRLNCPLRGFSLCLGLGQGLRVLGFSPNHIIMQKCVRL